MQVLTKSDYAILPDRIKAAIIDALLLIAAMYAASELLNLFDNVPNYVRIVIAVLLFILYDPLFTSQFGGTIGHSFSNITVRKDTDRENYIGFPSALVRFIFKFTLGWVSLLTVTGNKKKKAVHDYIANSVVVTDK
ncbi:RDD family protein [Maribacter confluentis]|uniref:RDD family protein n=1 Tax=Maribacter confluentis TaxID=1656093 RepID=A0ABT8RNC6_9FLAO|nr:RDD family protein [Maribacter confluentis]MDO1512422.1 RDD family protein [Maribacter confluentis]